MQNASRPMQQLQDDEVHGSKQLLNSHPKGSGMPMAAQATVNAQ